MANAAGLVQESIWRDPDFRRIRRTAQTLYVQLLSQKELDCAGILPLQPDKWATGCDELTVEQVWDDLNVLQGARFVFYDIDTYEAFIRSYMRGSNVLKVPNMFKSALRSARLVGSPMLRCELALELRRVQRAEASGVADEIDPNITNSPVDNLTLTEGLAKGSGTLTEPTGVGVGMGTGVTLVTTQVGERRPKCSKHETNTEDVFCRPCMKRRQWDEARATELQADELNQKRAAKAAATKAMHDCNLCDDEGWVLGSDNKPVDPAVKCQAHNTQQEAGA